MHPLIILLVVLFGVFFSYIAYHTWRENAFNFRNTILLLSISLAWLSFTYSIELISTTLGEMVLLNGLEYLSYASLPTIFLYFALSYTGKEHHINRRVIIASAIMPIFFVIMVWTNDLHHLFYLSVKMGTSFGINEMDTVKGPLYLAYTVYNYLTLLLCMILIGLSIREAPDHHRKQSLAILGACLLPAIGVILVMVGFIALPVGFVVVMCYSFCGFVFYLGALRTEVFVLLPVASTTIVENMSDATIATDLTGRVIRINPAGERLLGAKARKLLGEDLVGLFPTVKLRDENDSGPVLIKQDKNDRYYNLRISPLRLRNGMRVGTLYIFRDITELESAREELRMANTKLNLISNITRHDMLNQLVVVRGFSNLLNEQHLQGKGERYLDGINSAVVTMEHLIDFARDYQKFGLEAPSWNKLDNVLSKARITLTNDSVQITNMDHLTELFFDQMLEKVFYNLFDNSMRHGGDVKNITISTQQNGKGLLVVFEDDGVGIPEGEKDQIFRWGFGKNTGLGLAMCQQILTLSNWTIIENGAPGKGARFVISVPEKDWRST